MRDLYKGFKKIQEDDKRAVLQHEKGHEIVISKNGISKKQLKSLSNLPLHQAEGTKPIEEPMVAPEADAGEALKNVGAQISEAVAKKVVEGAEQSISPQQIAAMPEPTATDVATGEPVYRGAGATSVEEPGPRFAPKYPLPPSPLASINPFADRLPGETGNEYAARKQREYDEYQAAQRGEVTEPVAMEPGKQAPGMLGATTPSAQEAIPPMEAPMQMQPEPERAVSTAPTYQPKAPEAKVKTLEAAATQASADIETPDEDADYAVLADPNTTYTQKAAALVKRSNEAYQKMLKSEQDFRSAMENKQFTRPELFQDKGVLGKILGVIGLALSGGGGALSGQGNLALDYLNKQIDREIETQKRNYDKDLNIHKFHMEQLKDVAQADLATATTLKQVALMEMDEKLGLLGNNPLAKQRMMAARSQLVASMETDRQRLLQMGLERKILERRLRGMTGGAAAGTAGAPGQMQGLNPENPALFLQSVEKNLQGKAADEISHRRNVNKIMEGLLDKFDKIDKLGYTPGAVQAYQAELVSLVPLIEGSFSAGAVQAAMEKLTPKKFNIPGKNKEIKKALIDYAKSKSADTAFSSSMMNLDDFASTSHKWMESEIKPEATQRRQTATGKVALFDKNNKFIGYE